MKDFDVIVIGSGIGGLISAGTLVSKGMKTLLVEKNKIPGGLLASFKRKGFLFNSAVDCISGVAKGGYISNVLESLDVDSEINFVKLNPIRFSIFPDIRIPVDSNMNVYIERLIQLFPSEASGIKKLFNFMDGSFTLVQSMLDSFLSGKPGLGKATHEIFELRNISYKDLLRKYITNYRLTMVLSDRCPFIGLPPSRVSAFSMVNMIMSYFKLGAYRPIGGFQKLADILVKGIENKGGTVLLGNGADKILLENNNRCYGVRCENGNEYTSEFVVSSVDSHHTFGDLLGREFESIPTEMRKKTGISTSFFVVYAGVKGEVTEHSSVGYFPSYDMESFFSPKSSFKNDSTIGVTVASMEDKLLAPDACNTVVLHEMAEASDKEIDKSVCTEIVIKKAEKIIPGLKDKIIVLDSATPKSIERYTGNFNGSAFGWNQIPGFKNVKGYGINNLYIAGHWGEIGGGVLAAAYSGAKAAKEILTKESVTNGI